MYRSCERKMISSIYDQPILLFWIGNTTVSIADPDPQKDKNGLQKRVKKWWYFRAIQGFLEA
jgi:hypothetical protein